MCQRSVETINNIVQSRLKFLTFYIWVAAERGKRGRERRGEEVREEEEEKREKVKETRRKKKKQREEGKRSEKVP